MIENQDDVDQKRFLLAMVLSGVILIAWQTLFPPPPPPETPDEAPTVEQTDDAKTADGAPAEETAKPVDVPKDLPVVEHRMQTDAFSLVLTSADARVTEVTIKTPQQYAVEGNLLSAVPKDSEFYPFGITFTDNSIPLRRGLVWQFVESESVKTGETWGTVVYRHTDPGGRFQIDKIFKLKPDVAHVLELDVVVKNRLSQGQLADRLAIDITGYNDPTEERSFLDMLPDSLEGVCKLEDDVERELFDALEGPEVFSEGGVIWAGADTRYFLFAAVPLERGERCTIAKVEENYIRTRLEHVPFKLAPQESKTFKYQLFAGPKDYDHLDEIGYGLQESVDYGVLTFLCRPMRWALVLFYGWLGNWGLAIILLTLLIRLMTWPLTHKMYANSEKMKQIQPLINEVKEKYENDQQRQAEETMKIFKEHGASPLGCAPMFLQLPILIALYYMILYSVELYQADFMLWYTDLSAPDPYFVLPILMGVFMLAQQQLMTIDTGNKQMVMMMKIMPVMFTAFMLFLPSGVVLYYLISLIIGVVQQVLIKRSFKDKAAAA